MRRKCGESCEICFLTFKQKVARTKCRENPKIKMLQEVKVSNCWKREKISLKVRGIKCRDWSENKLSREKKSRKPKDFSCNIVTPKNTTGFQKVLKNSHFEQTQAFTSILLQSVMKNLTKFTEKFWSLFIIHKIQLKTPVLESQF